MTKPLISVLRKELANLHKDAESHKSAMKALKSYVKDLDIKVIPYFLAQVSETKETGVSSGDYTISLFEDLVRFHGAKTVPHIENIMTTVVKTLAWSEGSFPLQQACSKVVSAIARYGIDPSTAIDKRRYIIHSVCNPLSDSLLASQESLASGSSLCLRDLVDCDNWRCASDEMVNKVCQNVAVALEKNFTETNSHLALVMALAKHNPFIIEPYARLLVRSGLRILDSGAGEGNSKKRLLAIQMVNCLMKNLEFQSMESEMELIIAKMEYCQLDSMHFVRMAAYESMKTAKKIVAGDNACGSSGYITESDFSSGKLMNGSDRFGNDLLSDFEEGCSFQDSPLAAYGDDDEEFVNNGFQHEIPINGFLRRTTPSIQLSQSCVAPSRTSIFDTLDTQNDCFTTPCSRNQEEVPTHYRQRGLLMHDLTDKLREEGEMSDSICKQQSEDQNKSEFSVHDAVVGDTSTQISSSLSLVDGTKNQMDIVDSQKMGGSRRVLRCGLSLLSVAVAGLASLMWVFDDDQVQTRCLLPT